MHEIERVVVIPLPRVCGIDLSVTNEVLLLWAAAAVTFVLLAIACRRKSLVPRGVFRNLFEALIEFIEQEIVRGSIGRQGRAWSPFLLTLFFFILFCNLLGAVPLPEVFKSVTSSLGVTVGLALLVFGVTLAVNLSRHGLSGFVKKFLPAGVPWWICPLVVPIEIVSWLAKPVSLAIRLFANMLVGHALIVMFVGLAAVAAWYLKALPFLGAVAMSCFEIFIAFIQAFIFTLLAGVYIKDALEAH
jgi:F-type H+-transporting ATPase subunit a